MYAYQVGTEFYYNVYLALRQAWKTGNQLKFYCRDDEWDTYDWSHEPEASLDFLMADYAHRLRNENERLILAYSGGTDSQTIYDVFAQNRIHLDEIFVKADDHTPHHPRALVDWLRKNHWDPDTIITEVFNYDHDIKLKEHPDEDWVWQNRSNLFLYAVGPTSDGVLEQIGDRHQGKNYKIIFGTEKPRLVYRDGAWHHRQMSLCFNMLMGLEQCVAFYMEPLIAIKQSHLVKAGVKKLIADHNLPLYNDDWAEAKWPRTAVGYRAWCLSTGRHDELYLGLSYTQKVMNDSLDQTEVVMQGDWKERYKSVDSFLYTDLINDCPAALNYVRGFANLTSEFGFHQYLKDNGWFRNSEYSLRRLRFVWCKEQNIGS